MASLTNTLDGLGSMGRNTAATQPGPRLGPRTPALEPEPQQTKPPGSRGGGRMIGTPIDHGLDQQGYGEPVQHSQ